MFLFFFTLDPQAYLETIGYIMLVKFGVDISRLNREIRRSMNPVAFILQKKSIPFIITSTYEGNHSAGSLHYSNDAYDIRANPAQRVLTLDLIKRRLGPAYDVVSEPTYLHIEYDPKWNLLITLHIIANLTGAAFWSESCFQRSRFSQLFWLTSFFWSANPWIFWIFWAGTRLSTVLQFYCN